MNKISFSSFLLMDFFFSSCRAYVRPVFFSAGASAKKCTVAGVPRGLEEDAGAGQVTNPAHAPAGSANVGYAEVRGQDAVGAPRGPGDKSHHQGDPQVHHLPALQPREILPGAPRSCCDSTTPLLRLPMHIEGRSLGFWVEFRMCGGQWSSASFLRPANSGALPQCTLQPSEKVQAPQETKQSSSFPSLQ